MSPPVIFLPDWHPSEKGDPPSGRRKVGFSTRIEGYAKSRKVWTCQRCRAWHERKKPKRCDQCNHPHFLYYDSAGEARWFVGLMRELDHGSIVDLQHHPAYPIHVAVGGELPRATTKVFDYVADAEYVRADELVTADFKPWSPQGLDPVFKLKRRCFEAQYGRVITVITER